MSRDCWDAVGGMDLSTFGRYGWGSTWISRYGLESPGMACTQPRWPTSTISGARPPIRTSVGTGITGVQVRP